MRALAASTLSGTIFLLRLSRTGVASAGLMRAFLSILTWLSSTLGCASTRHDNCGVFSKAEAIRRVRDEQRGVVNGTAYDRGSLEVKDVSELLLPDTAIWSYGDSKQIVIQAIKSFGFGGWPSRPMTIDEQRWKLGAIYYPSPNRIALWSTGTWRSIEGGADVTLIVTVPREISVRQVSNKYLSMYPKIDPAIQISRQRWIPIEMIPDRETAERLESDIGDSFCASE